MASTAAPSAPFLSPRPTQREAAVYYLRVLEIETPRWTTLLAASQGLPRPQDSPATLQERAWCSPIWYRAAATFE